MGAHQGIHEIKNGLIVVLDNFDIFVTLLRDRVYTSIKQI